jgi:protein phosphatase
MLRVAEHWHGTDVGRARQGNEDSYFVQVPLFVVADGMGGAQAGEVASELAVEAFHGGLSDGAAIEELVRRIRQANRRIHDMSRSHSELQGMGTTCTATYVAEEEVVLAHVGDSRCYLLRDGELTRLTRDHSLVGELMDRGKLTEEQAEVHPQRSVITRALGVEGDVQVDTERIAARSGDLFLLCSDGLTSMVREAQLAPVLERAGTLEQAGRSLIDAANAAGGRDNITVVLFRLDEVVLGEHLERTAEQSSAVRDTTDQATSSHAPVAQATDEQEAAYRAQGTVAMAAIRPAPETEAEAEAPPRPEPRARGTTSGRLQPLPPSESGPRRRPPAPPPRRGLLRRAVKPLLVLLILLVLVGFSAWVAVRAVFFVGLDANRAVTIYRGLPYELPGGIKLYTRDYTSGVTIDQVAPGRRSTFTNHKLRSNSDAQDLVRQLETGTIGSAGEAGRGGERSETP